ncbi:MAG TPA: response regulator transcription factor [Telluria sp.]|nr:response regulator transcription factor [Telluria sp.]
MRILIIEDNPAIVANLYEFLEPKGHVLDSASSAYAGLALAAEHAYDVVVLDVSLPGMTGLDFCAKLRSELKNPVPVMMLTARDTLDDKVAGFAAGADDYLVKPFSLVELEVRLGALVRRAGRPLASAEVLRVGDLTFDTATYEVARAGVPLSLTPTGYTLLRCLMGESPRMVRRSALEHAVWGDSPPDSDALRTHIHALRQAIDKPFATAMLHTAPGLGYKLVPA